MAMVLNTSKREQEQIANDEYTATIQSIIDKDPVASKYFNADDITYPLMDKSGSYNVRGFLTRSNRSYAITKKAVEEFGSLGSSMLTSESTFNSKLKKEQGAIGILQTPFSTTSSPEDMDKISVILHETRHKAFRTPEAKKFLRENGLNEEILNRFLDIKSFPFTKKKVTEFLDAGFKLGFKGLEAKYTAGADKFNKLFGKQPGSLLNK